jgi:hypothetical protein
MAGGWAGRFKNTTGWWSGRVKNIPGDGPAGSKTHPESWPRPPWGPGSTLKTHPPRTSTTERAHPPPQPQRGGRVLSHAEYPTNARMLWMCQVSHCCQQLTLPIEWGVA